VPHEGDRSCGARDRGPDPAAGIRGMRQHGASGVAAGGEEGRPVSRRNP